MKQLAAAALILIAVIAFLLVITDLPWGTGPNRQSQGQGQTETPLGGAMASEHSAQTRPLALPTHDTDTMAAMTRGVLRDLRRAKPSSGERLQQVSQAADAAAQEDTLIALFRAEATRPDPQRAALQGGPSAEIRGVTSVAASGPDRSVRPPERRHIVAEGETLSTIAMRVYGRASAWQMIYDANRDQLSRPDDLPLGAALLLPRQP